MVDALIEETTEETITQDVIYALAASPEFAQDGLCFAAQASGLYRSEDGGITWQSTYDSLELEQALATTAVVISPEFGTDQTVFAGAPGGVLRSEDGGQSWTVVMFPSPPPTVSTMVVSPNFASDGVVLAGTMEDGVFRSANGGRNWSIWNFGLLDLRVISMVISPDFVNDETLYVGTESGIFWSGNGGRAWREVDLPVGFTAVLSLALSPNFAEDGVIFAGTESYGLFKSNDFGESWIRLGEAVITDIVNGIVLSPDFSAKPEILVALGEALLISRDGGDTWSPWDASLPVDQGLASVAAPHGLDAGAPLLVGLAEGGVIRSG